MALKILMEVEGKLRPIAEAKSTTEAIAFCRAFCQARPGWYYVDFGGDYKVEWKDLVSNPEEEP